MTAETGDAAPVTAETIDAATKLDPASVGDVAGDPQGKLSFVPSAAELDARLQVGLVTIEYNGGRGCCNGTFPTVTMMPACCTCCVRAQYSTAPLAHSVLTVRPCVQDCVSSMAACLQTFTPIDVWLAGQMSRLPVACDQGCMHPCLTCVRLYTFPCVSRILMVYEFDAVISLVVNVGPSTTKICAESHTL